MRITIIFLALIATAIAGCKHDKARPIGGKGGAAKLTVYPQHHGVSENLDSMIVYIKYDALDAPESGRYDDSATCEWINNLPVCSFGNLWNGDYYLLSKGYDHLVGQQVKGGLQYTIQAQQAYTLFLPVSEGQH
jgi:hypothetical protein